MFGMNFEQVMSLVRQGLIFMGGMVVKAGYTDESNMTMAVGAITTLIGSVWAVYTRRKAGLINAAAGLNEVGKIVTTPALADATPSDKVVSR